MENQTLEVRYIKKAVLENLLSNLFNPGYTIEINGSFYVLNNLPRRLTETEITQMQKDSV